MTNALRQEHNQPKQFAVMIQTNCRTDRYRWIAFRVETNHALAWQHAERLAGAVVEQGSHEQAIMLTEFWV